jgi:hypothetical protein
MHCKDIITFLGYMIQNAILVVTDDSTDIHAIRPGLLIAVKIGSSVNS